MDTRVVNLEEKAGLINELHKYKLVAELNDYQFKLVKAQREFIWHSHEETDEIFELKKGELIVVPKGVEHKPICDKECTLMLVEPKGTINTGNAGGDLTDNELEWI
jgi:mannose-6-phosphate isomerase-like protein (cupin superfamily)